MSAPFVFAIVALGSASPAFAATGMAPDFANLATLFAGFSMVGLTATGRRKRTGRVAD
jgi:hypothetical protein